MADPETVIAIYRFRPDVTDASVADLLRRHREVLERSGLVTSTRPTVLRSMEAAVPHRDFIEIFEWRAPDSAGKAHAVPAIRTLWGEIEALSVQHGIALRDLAEAGRPFAHFAPFPVRYGAASAGRPEKPAARKRPKRAATKRGASKKAAPSQRRPGKRAARRRAPRR
jgi:hypothetical protein